MHTPAIANLTTHAPSNNNYNNNNHNNNVVNFANSDANHTRHPSGLWRREISAHLFAQEEIYPFSLEFTFNHRASPSLVEREG